MKAVVPLGIIGGIIGTLLTGAWAVTGDGRTHEADSPLYARALDASVTDMTSGQLAAPHAQASVTNGSRVAQATMGEPTCPPFITCPGMPSCGETCVQGPTCQEPTCPPNQTCGTGERSILAV